MLIIHFVHRDILDALKASLEWSGTAKLLIPILGRLVDNTANEKYATALELLVTSKRTPKSITKHLVKTVLLKGEGSELLTALYQRYTEILRTSVDELVAEDEEKKLELEQMIMSLAMVRLICHHKSLFPYSLLFCSL